jgi:hypothetical protein
VIEQGGYASSVKTTATAAARVRTTSTGKKSVSGGVAPPLPDPKKLRLNQVDVDLML